MKQLKISVLMLLIFTLLTGVIYPLAITGIGRVLFSSKIDGSLIVKDGMVRGSLLIGQNFVKPGFVQGRPSAVNYDAGGSGGSNLGPANKKLINSVILRAEHVRNEFNLSPKTSIPSDFIFASGSGLDPHISVEAAMLQAVRIASERRMNRSEVENLIKLNSERQLNFYGSSYVNVLKLNLALNEKGEPK